MKKTFLQVFIICTLLGIVTPSSSYAATAPSFTIEYGPTETVYSWQRDKCEDGDAPDTPARALVDSNGNLQLYGGNPVNRKFIGNNLSEVKRDCHVIMSSHNNADPRAYDDYEWLAAPYTLDGTTIYSLVHTEYHGYAHNNCNTNDPNYWVDCWWNSINLAKSTDIGATFTHANPPNQNIVNTSIDYNPNNTNRNIGFFQPSNILKKDGYYYAKMWLNTAPILMTQIPNNPYSNSSNGVCVMRTNNLNDPASWRFWDGTGFNTPTRGVPAVGTCAGVFSGGNDWDWHWSDYLQTYTSIGGKDNQLLIQSTKNLTVVDTPEYLFNQPLTNISAYYTFLQPGAETRNFEDIGRSPWMYYLTCGDDLGACSTWTNDRDLKRVRVRFNKPEDVGKYDVLDLHFNEYKGTKTLDSSFYGNDGTLSGNVNFAQDGDTKFIHFPNTPGSITVPNSASLQLTGNMTFTTRIRTTQAPPANTYPTILVKSDATKRSYGIFLIPGGQIHFSLMNGTQLASSVSNQKINDGAWHDVQINFDSSTGKATYVIDGKLDSTVNQGGKLSDGVSNGNISIGGGSFVGDLDHVTLYNYLLPTPTSSNKPGDLNGDGKVDIFDYNQLVANFGHPYSIFDYNTFVGNFGK